jgi:hypothetical protein
MVGLMAWPAPANAITIAGNIALSSDGGVRVGDSWIDWGHHGAIFESGTYTNCEPGVNPGACVIDGTTTGDINFDFGLGSFLDLTGTEGNLRDLEDSFAPVNTPMSLHRFLESDLHPEYDFELTFIPLGSGNLAGCLVPTSGSSCTPPGSPFTINNLGGAFGGPATEAQVAFLVRGLLRLTSDPSTVVSMWEGRFSQTLPMDAAEILAEIATNGYIQTSHSGTFEVTFIPEPATLLTFGTGTALLAAIRRSRRKKNQSAQA